MNEKKEVMESGHHRRLLGWSFGMLAMIFSIMQPIAGIIFSLVGLIVSMQQGKNEKTEWSRTGKILSMVGLIVSIIVIVVSFVALRYISANSDLLAQLQQAQTGGA